MIYPIFIKHLNRKLCLFFHLTDEHKPSLSLFTPLAIDTGGRRPTAQLRPAQPSLSLSLADADSLPDPRGSRINPAPIQITAGSSERHLNARRLRFALRSKKSPTRASSPTTAPQAKEFEDLSVACDEHQRLDQVPGRSSEGLIARAPFGYELRG
uniref:Uncharacterized protein n=1 Tax=Fagus sylvatica TaxID=28930 RepID=A0A2N9H807_FAGSY